MRRQVRFQRDRHAVVGFQKHRGKGLIGHCIDVTGHAGGQHAERAEQPAQDVEVMDEHLGDEQAGLGPEQRLALERGKPRVLLREETRDHAIR